MAEDVTIETGSELAASKVRVEPSLQYPVYIPCIANDRVHQAEIISDLTQWVPELDAAGKPAQLRPRVHPFAIVMTQDCDLEQDFRERSKGADERDNDRLLPSVLFCEMMNFDRIIDRCRIKGKDNRKGVERNDNFRFQYLRAVLPDNECSGNGIPQLCIDFKRYFTIPTDEVYRQADDNSEAALRRCQLNECYREHLQHRFATCFSRVSLELDHHMPFPESAEVPVSASSPVAGAAPAGQS